MDRLLSMRTFAKVVDEGSFAGAARRLDLNQAVVTRLVADLEGHLGARLLHRTTRSLRLTDAGERYLQRCRQILADVEAAEELARDGQGRIAGLVRLAVPSFFGLEVMAPRGQKFHDAFPDIVLDISLLDRPVDLVAEGYDIAVVPSALGVPSSLIARPLAVKSIGLCASPEYLRRCGTPEQPEELQAHACIGFSQYSGRDRWRLHRDAADPVEVAVRFVLQSNSLVLVHRAVAAGLGIGPQVSYELEPELADPRVVPVLPQWKLGSFELSLVYPSREHLPRRVRAVLDFFIEERDALADCRS